MSVQESEEGPILSVTFVSTSRQEKRKLKLLNHW